MRILSLVALALCPAAVTAVPVAFAADMTKYQLTNFNIPAGTTVGHVVSADTTSLSFVGSVGPLLYGGSGTVVKFEAVLPQPMNGEPLGPIPKAINSYSMLQSPSASARTVDLRGYIEAYGISGYKAAVAHDFGVMIAELPTWERYPYDFEFYGEFNVAITTTTYSVAGAYQPRVETSFDAVFVENDIPNTHRAFGENYGYFSSGRHQVAGRVDRFSILNSDNAGGPASLTISNLTYSVEPGSYGRIVSNDAVAAYRFVLAIPEPSTYALMIVGLCAIVGVARRR